MNTQKSPLEKFWRFQLNAHATGTKDLSRLLNKLRTLQAPLELSREETASMFFGLIRPCFN